MISLIGEELISDEPVALVELVKNAYDADASQVVVEFRGPPASPERLVVTDDGIGMSLETVLSSWFEPGTVAKRLGTSSPSGRPLQGAKGIGRFASARLARSLLLESKQPGDATGVYVLLEWGRFDDDSYLDELSVDWEVVDIPDLKSGTRLTLEGLRKTWDHDDYLELHARLSRLTSPFRETEDFSIVLEIPSEPELSGVVAPPPLVLRPRYELVGDIDAQGRFEGEFRVDGTLSKLFPRWSLSSIGDQRPECGPFAVEIRAWDRDRDGLAPFAESLSLSLAEVRRTLDAYCGVSVYRNGFRVHPYGERGNDWLSLDNRSRQNPVTHLANNQIIAAIRISRDANPELRDRSTREGMVVNPAYRALEDWFVLVLSRLEEERYRLRPRKKAETSTDPLFESLDLTSTVDFARSQLGVSHPVAIRIADSERQLRAGAERIEGTFSRLLLAAGLGQMVDVVLHEIGSPLGKVTRQLPLLRRELVDCLEAQPPTRAPAMLSSIDGWLEQIQGLRQRLEPQTAGRRGRASTFNVEDEIADNFDLYSALLARNSIRHEVISPKGPTEVTMSRAALGQVIANLLDNSIHWLSRSGPSRGGRIAVEISPLESGFTIKFSDDGPGVLSQDRALIFEPYFTKKPNGIGLGLYITRFLMEPYGRIEYADDCALNGACFSIVFERGVGR